MNGEPASVRAARLARLGGLYAIVGDEDTVARAEAAVEGGAGCVQVRMKRSPAGRVLEAAREIAARWRGRALVIVNDRVDLAVLAGADGVHLGDEDLPVPEARRLCGEGMLVGRTCRTAEEARRALAEGADHVGYGPVFPSRTKPIDVAPRGLEGVAALRRAIAAPIVAISGIELANIGDVAAAGATAAAVVGDLFERGDPPGIRARARLLAEAFAEGARRRREP